MTITQRSDTNAHWQDVLAAMQADRRFHRFKKFRWYGEVEGARVGAVVAHRGEAYANYALNREDVENLLAAKRTGKVDHAFVVAVALGTFVAYHDAEELYTALLEKLSCRTGPFGEFWLLTEFMVANGNSDEPF
jgi:hypothetical protein